MSRLKIAHFFVMGPADLFRRSMKYVYINHLPMPRTALILNQLTF